MTSPWRQDVTTPATFGPTQAPPGAVPAQVAPVGSPPPSAGDPDLLPQLTTTGPVDLSALFGQPAGTTTVFVIPMTAGSLASRAKLILSFVWTWDSMATVPFATDQYVVQLGTIPAGTDPGLAIKQGLVFVNDHGLSGIRPVVKGGYEPPVYIGPGFTGVVFVQNTNAALDPTAGVRQLLFAQWRTV